MFANVLAVLYFIKVYKGNMSIEDCEDDEAFQIPLQARNKNERTAGVQEAGQVNRILERRANTIPKARTGWRRYVGLVFALLCALFFSITVLLAKILNQSQHFHPFVISMWRYGGILVPSIPIAFYFKVIAEVPVFETLHPLKKKASLKNLLAYFMQGILGCTATIFRFISLQYIPIADSTVVFSAYTVVVTIFAHFCLGETCGVFSVILAVTTAVGVMIMSRPPIITGESDFDIFFLKGIMYAVLALFCTATFLILMRKIRETHFALLMLVGGVWGVLESAALSAILGVLTWPQSILDWGLLSSLMLLTFCGQTCFVLAVKFENAGPLAIARTSESIYAFIWQYLFLSIVPDFISITGGFLVITAVICIGYRKYLDSLPVTNPTRRRFRFLLK